MPSLYTSSYGYVEVKFWYADIIRREVALSFVDLQTYRRRHRHEAKP